MEARAYHQIRSFNVVEHVMYHARPAKRMCVRASIVYIVEDDMEREIILVCRIKTLIIHVIHLILLVK
jgi:hypothetical protein